MPYFEDTSVSAVIKEVANFRAWGQKISEGLTAVGMVKTSDTGQINFETVELPAINNYAGYEIWRFNDAEQSERPIYFKIEYGRSTTESGPSALKVTVGTGSNGSGTITNASTAREAKPTGTPSENGLIYISFHKGALSMVSATSQTQGGVNATLGVHVLIIQRPRNALDNTPLNAIAFHCGTGEAVLRSLSVYANGSWGGTVRLCAVGGSEVINNTLLPAYSYIVAPILSAPLHGLIGSRAGAIGSGDTGKFTVAGEEITYKRIPISKGVEMESPSEGTNFLITHES